MGTKSVYPLLILKRSQWYNVIFPLCSISIFIHNCSSLFFIVSLFHSNIAPCNNGEFECANSRCIDAKLADIFDFNDNCGDGSDLTAFGMYVCLFQWLDYTEYDV